MRIWVYRGSVKHASSKRTLMWIVGPNNQWAVHINNEGDAGSLDPTLVSAIKTALENDKGVQWERIL